MVRIARWVLIGSCLIALIQFLAVRGGLGEYARGASLTTAHLGTCYEDVDQVENAVITCAARWTVDERAIEGTVTGVDSTGSRGVPEGVSGNHYEVRLPITDVTVFADGTGARPANTRYVVLGGGFLIALVALLAWEAVAIGRRAAARRSAARLGRREATV